MGAARLLQPGGTATPGTFMSAESWRVAEQAGDGDEAALPRSLSREWGQGNHPSGQAVGLTATLSPPNVSGRN